MTGKILSGIYRKLYSRLGPRHWWPAASAFEVAVGAILTQNTAWPNVEKAITNLKKAKSLSPEKIASMHFKKLASLVRPSGFYNEKARKLKNFVKFLSGFSGGNINRLRTLETRPLRKMLLGVNGIGPETADSILLYGLGKPIFVVDAYTRRIFERHRLIKKDDSYDEIQAFFMNSLPKDARLFNEYHALIVETGKRYCKNKNPRCNLCPLMSLK